MTRKILLYKNKHSHSELECFAYDKVPSVYTDEDGEDHICSTVPFSLLANRCVSPWSFSSSIKEIKEGEHNLYLVEFGFALTLFGGTYLLRNYTPTTNLMPSELARDPFVMEKVLNSVHELGINYTNNFTILRKSPRETLANLSPVRSLLRFDDASDRLTMGAFVFCGCVEQSDKSMVFGQLTEHLGRNALPRSKGFKSSNAYKERKKMSPKLRRQVLERDNFRCVDCGTSPQNDPNCILHVDHRIAVSRGGKSNINNLQTLCADCNTGKGVSMDWKLNQVC